MDLFNEGSPSDVWTQQAVYDFVKPVAAALLVAERERDTLREAVMWYANVNRYRVGAWRQDDGTDGAILADNGARARAALASVSPKGEAS
jgi:hypothetical protein